MQTEKQKTGEAWERGYRNVPVSPEDRFLLEMCWEGKVYVDTALPFGLRSAPLIFTALAEALLWIMRQKGATNTDNYIDDFVTVGAPDSQECERNTTIMHETCEEVGLPTEPKKDEGPATTISFLGMELDTVALEICLPAEKLLQWSESYLDCHISSKELVPIIIAAVIWGKDWGGKTIRVWCDNIAAVSTVNLGTSRNQEAMHLARCLVFIKAKFKFDLVAAHLPGASNCRADALSRNRLSLFRTLHQQANQEPIVIPEALLDLLIVSRPDWTSKH